MTSLLGGNHMANCSRLGIRQTAGGCQVAGLIYEIVELASNGQGFTQIIVTPGSEYLAATSGI